MVRRAFTMVEMIVVIGVLLVLTGLLVAVFPAVVNTSKTNETESVLRLLDMALGEWSLAADREPTFGEDANGRTFDLQSTTPTVYTTTELLALIGRSEQGRSAIEAIEDKYLYRFDTSEPAPKWVAADPDALAAYENDDLNGRDLDGLNCVLDGWGEPIMVVHPGRSVDLVEFLKNSEPDCIDLDRTERTEFENQLGAAVNQQVAFVSAGADRKFGDLHLEIESFSSLDDDQRGEADLSLDNVPSYVLEDVRCTP